MHTRVLKTVWNALFPAISSCSSRFIYARSGARHPGYLPQPGARAIIDGLASTQAHVESSSSIPRKSLNRNRLSVVSPIRKRNDCFQH